MESAKGDIKAFGRIEHSGTRFVDPKHTSEQGFRLTQPGDLLMTSRDLTQLMEVLGLVSPIPTDQKYLVNQGANVIRLSNELDPRYFVYWCNGPDYRTYIKTIAVGSTQLHIRKPDFLASPIDIPPLPTQRRIAQILGRLDDKIELNRRINRTLEAMAQALYRHHFVEFGPYQDGPFVDSELGSIPQGWEVGRLGDYIQATKGLSYKGKYLSDEGMPLHNLNSVYEGGGYKYEGIKFYKSDDFKERHLISPGDLIVANTEQGFDYLLIGCPAIIPKRFGEVGLFTHHIYKIDFPHPSPLTAHWLYFWLKNDSLRQAVTAFTNGTTVNMLARDGLQYPQLVVPPNDVVQRFDKFARSVIGQIEQNEDENRKLAEIRDYLLPRLLSGEIEV